MVNPDNRDLFTSGILGSDSKENFFSGNALIFDFNTLAETGKKYYLKLSWCLSDNPWGWYLNRFTDVYEVNTFQNPAWTTSNMINSDPDKNKNLVDDQYDVVPNRAPTVPSNLSPASDAVAIGTAPTLSWDCSDPDSDPLTYDVYFGTANPPTTKVSSDQTAKTLSRSGLANNTPYYWQVTAKDNKGNSTPGPTWKFTTQAPLGTAPVADFSATPSSITKGQSVQFTDKSTNTPTSWLWTFGDGTTSTAQNPTKTYSTVGTYTVSLKATNSFGNNTKTLTNCITVNESGVSFSSLFDMILVEGGTFQMGSTLGFNEQPVHTVTVSSFKISETEVTQALWKKVMGDNNSYFIGDNLPVEQVSWFDAQAFIQKLNEQTGMNYRLPTEAEWEFAARGGNHSKNYTYSGSNYIEEVAWYMNNSGDKTHPVATKLPNELGLYDMTGNVWEWCNDIYEQTYPSSAQTNPVGPLSGTNRVIRGGGFREIVDNCRATVRDLHHQGNLFKEWGFRIAQSYEGSVNIGSAPAVDFSASKTSITKGQTIQFTDKSTNLPTSWLWTFGDGTTSTAQNPTKTYNTAGTYTVSLKATNSFGNNTKTLTNYITVSETGTGGTGTLVYQGRTYKTVIINGKEWMAENLAYLPAVHPPSSESYTEPRYYVYGYTGSDVATAKQQPNYTTYGVLYNWPAAIVAYPPGWHLPSDAEWTALENYLIANGYNYDGTTTGNKIAKSMAATTNWAASSNTGAIGNNLSLNNKSGFAALPAGYRYYDGTFGSIGSTGYWWSSTELTTNYAWLRYMYYYYSGVSRYDFYKEYGFSVRCVRD